MKKTISLIAACIGTLLLAAGIALPSASADPTTTPSPAPTRKFCAMAPSVSCLSDSDCPPTYADPQEYYPHGPCVG